MIARVYFWLTVASFAFGFCRRVHRAMKKLPLEPREHWEYFADSTISLPLFYLAYLGLS